MREVISIHVGQAGVQIGNACCELSPLSLFAVENAQPTRFPFELYSTVAFICVLIKPHRGALHHRAWSQREYPCGTYSGNLFANKLTA